ncbi:zinc finger protein 426-like [Thomomys bottae]
MADTPPSTVFSLSAKSPVNIQQEMVTNGETTHVHPCNLIGFEDVSLDFTKEEWVLLSSEQKKMYREVMLNNYENLCDVVFYFSKPSMLTKSDEEQDRMEREIFEGFYSGRMSPLTSQPLQLTQISLQPETLSIKEEPTDGYIFPEYNTTGETLCTEATIAGSGQMGSGGQSSSWDDSQIDLGEFFQGRPRNSIQHEEGSNENDRDTNPSGIRALVVELGRNHIGLSCYQCSNCGQFFSSFTQLTEHKKSHTRRELLKCSRCERTFLCPTALQSHLKVHTRGKEYRCNTCRQCFCSSSNLKRHATIHTGEKPYECPDCKKRFRDIYLLKQHQLIHSEYKRHQCNECLKAFHRRSHLTRHMGIHARGK